MEFHKCEICKKEIGEQMFLFSFDNAHYHAFCHEHLQMFLSFSHSVIENIKWDGEKFVLESS